MSTEDRILDKLDKIDSKLDSVVERVAVTETKQNTMGGQIKLLLSLILAGITAAVGAIMDFFTKH